MAQLLSTGIIEPKELHFKEKAGDDFVSVEVYDQHGRLINRSTYAKKLLASG